MALRDATAPRGTKTAFACTFAAESERAAGVRGPAPPAYALRKRYVVGIFVEPSDAEHAVVTLGRGAARVCDVLVMSDPPADRAIPEAPPDGDIPQRDAFESVGPKLRAALTASHPFAALWESLSVRSDMRANAAEAPAIQRLYHHLVHRLASGAAVVVVYAPDPDLQLVASRALLDARCEVLLTHDVRDNSN